MMFWTRSAGIVDWVWLAWIVLPGGRTGPLLPGSQPTKYSPISDWGRDWQNTSVWNWPKPFWLMLTVSTACSGFWQCAAEAYLHRSIFLIEPTGTPAALKSDPVTSPKGLSR